MVRSKRLKQIKHKRQTNHKRQTKNKRHRQYGGRKYPYNSIDSSTNTNVLGESVVTEPVLIPGYSEILDMMKEYKDGTTESQQLIFRIKSNDVKVLSDCSYTHNITDIDNIKKIIVLRKTSKSFFGYTSGNNTIDCSNDNYYKFASHNFRIFIKDILEWNPFLNQPPKVKNKEVQLYAYYSEHNYSSDYNFINQEWWLKQDWWTSYIQTPEFRVAAEAAARTATAAAAAITGELKLKKHLVEKLKSEIARLEKQMIDTQTEIQETRVKLQQAEQ